LTVAGEATGVFLIRIVSALALGLLIAVVIAYFAARRLSQPLRAAREVAHEMAKGHRDRNLEPRGPAEVADIAEALNALSDALVVSEGRQRDFLLSVSHELRTPLTAVKGYGEALSEEMVPPQEIPAVGSIVASEAQRLDRLVHDLLDLARLGAVDFHFDLADVDAREIVTEASLVWQDRCSREQVGFETQMPPEPVGVRVDAWRLRQIIDNLTENALRVSPEGSTIVLALHVDPAIAAGDFAVVEVRDLGPGLSAEDRAVAFQPGALHERYRGVRPVGTGLGLALVARLAAGMGGSATVTSNPGGGTSFWVRVPRAPHGLQ
jgi:two-component system sensor histidine kinase BaeS